MKLVSRKIGIVPTYASEYLVAKVHSALSESSPTFGLEQFLQAVYILFSISMRIHDIYHFVSNET